MDIYSKDREGNNPIHICCSTGSFEGVDYFIKIKADFYRWNIYDEDCLLITLKYKLTPMIEYLLEIILIDISFEINHEFKIIDYCLKYKNSIDIFNKILYQIYH